MAFDWSQLDTSAGALIRSGAAVLSIVLGGFVLSAKPRRAFNVGLGVLLVVNGLNYGIYALTGGYSEYPSKELVVPALTITTACSLAVSAVVLAMTWLVVRDLPRRRTPVTLAAGAFLLLQLLPPMAYLQGDLRADVELYGSMAGVWANRLDSWAYGVFLGASLALGIALLSKADQGPATLQRGTMFLAAGLFMEVATWISIGVAYGGGDPNLSLPTRAAFVLTCLGIAAALAGFLFLRATGRTTGWTPVALSLGLLAAAAADTVAFGWGTGRNDHGLGGMLQIVGLALVAYAVFRLDVLSIRLPTLRNRAGILASLGLGALFITAQVAQNFFSDRLGLMVGGVVAGVTVFVAYPLQRAAERAVESRAPARGGPLDHYRRQVELAWRDGRLGANERLLLADTRSMLGIDAESALRIDDEVAAMHAKKERLGEGRKRAA